MFAENSRETPLRHFAFFLAFFAILIKGIIRQLEGTVLFQSQNKAEDLNPGGFVYKKK